MNSEILMSVFFIIAFCSMMGAFYLLPKEGKEIKTGIEWSFISFVTVLCIGALSAGILSLIHLPVNLVSMGIIYLVISLFMWKKIVQSKMKQKYEWSVFDFVLLILSGIVLFLLVRYGFTTDLKLRYVNVDAATHFKFAVSVVRDQKVTGMYFASLYNGLVIRLFQPFLLEVFWYKAFILADVSMLYLAVIGFYALIRKMFKTKVGKIVAILISGFYFLGYPLTGYIMCFVYWGIGVLLLIYLIMAVEYYRESEKKSLAILLLMLGCLGEVLCYMLFAPIAYISLFFILLYYAKQEGVIVCKKNVWLMLKVFAIPCLYGFYYCYFQFFMQSEVNVSSAISTEGWIYREWWIDFLWIGILALYAVIKQIKEKKMNIILMQFLCFAFVTIVMFLFLYKGKISSYYYYKMYYPLWMLSFVLGVFAIVSLWRESKEILIAIGVVFLGAFWLWSTKMETRVAERPYMITSIARTPNMFPIYEFNRTYTQDIDWGQYQKSDELLELFQYVIVDLKEEKSNIPLLVSADKYDICYWYEGITGQDCTKFYGWLYNTKKLKKAMEEQEVDYFLVLKNSEFYAKNQTYIDSLPRIYENSEGFILSTK